jgi:16S rRNA (guanine966-N2)-methyltransferase
MTRVIAGRARGRRLESLRGVKTRPTASRVKQTLFDILAPRLAGCRFLDLCAGTGAVGLEALSRGARRAVLVERDRTAAAVIRRNARLLAAERAQVAVRAEDCLVALRDLARARETFDVIYFDPPYEGALYEPVLDALSARGLVAGGGIVVVEHFHKRALPETIGGLSRERSVRIGDHRLAFYRLAAVEQGGASEPA